MEPTVQTYANVTNQIFPKRELAIIMYHTENTPLELYIYAVGDIVGPENICFFSKISNQRICIFLKNKQIVDNLIDNHGTINVNGNQVKLRRYIEPAKRLSIFCCPSVPNSEIEKTLKMYNIKMVSPINFLRANIPDPRYAHIMGFRRRVYIKENNDTVIPESVEIDHEEEKFRIFFSTEITCFTCKKTGHTAKQCPEKNPQSSEQEDMPLNPDEDASPFKGFPPSQSIKPLDAQQPPSTDPPLTLIQNPINSHLYNSGTKRSTRSSISSNEDDGKETNDQKKYKKDINKKGETSPKSPSGKYNSSQYSTEELLEPIREEMINNPNKYILSYEDLKDFLENVHGSNDQLNIARDYTPDIDGLLETLRTLYPYLEKRCIKGRFTRIMERIQQQLSKEQRTQNRN